MPEELEATVVEQATGHVSNLQLNVVAINDTNFPDPTFQTYVANYLDTDHNLYLSAAEIAAVKEISVNNMDISDLTGIEVFTALRVLSCYGNDLSSLNVSYFPELVSLNCGTAIMDGSTYGSPCGNRISKLDVHANPQLQYLWCCHNELTELDVSCNPLLVELGCYGNNIESLDVRSNPRLLRLLTGWNPLGTLDVSRNTLLQQLNCNRNELEELDLSHNTEISFLWCEENDLTVLNLGSQSELRNLNCYNNQLTALDLRGCPLLERLTCESNTLQTLELSACSSLYYLSCSFNDLDALDVGGCPALEYLYCSENSLSELNLSRCAALRVMDCSGNDLTSLDISACPGLVSAVQHGNYDVNYTSFYYEWRSAAAYCFIMCDLGTELITVPFPSSLVLDREYLALTQTDTDRQLTLTNLPDERMCFVVWSSDNKCVVEVDNAGGLTPGDVGTACITATVGGIASKPVSLTVKMGSAKIAQSVKSVTLLKDDCYDRAAVKLTVTDPTLSAIDRVVLYSPKDKLKRDVFALTDLGNGEYAIVYNERLLPAGFTGGTAKLNVFLRGNLSAKPNATLSVSVKLG